MKTGTLNSAPRPAGPEDGEAAAGTPVAPPGLGKRHLQVLLLFLAISMAYGIRINLSVAVVSMTNDSQNATDEVFHWDQAMRGKVLSSFFWGYTVMQVPGSMMVQRYGPRLFLLAAMAGCSLLAIATPYALMAVHTADGYAAYPMLLTIRVCQGLLSGLVFPSSHNMLSRWTPPTERARFASLVYGGMSLGTVASMGGAGMLCASSLGWPAAFYVPGALGLLWCVLWFCLSADTPGDCKNISREELEFIERSLGSSAAGKKSVAKVPWGSILTSLPVLSLVAVHCGQNFGHWMMLTEMPNYMKTALHYDMKSNGLLSSLPYISLWMSTFVVGWVGQRVNERGLVSLTTSRKIFNSCAHWGSGLTLLLLALIEPAAHGAVAMLIVAVSLEACVFAGFYVSHMDLSPNFGGALMALSNGCGSVMGILAPLIVGMILGDDESTMLESWDTVFIMTACIYFVGNLVYVIFCKAEVQPWNEPESSQQVDEKESGLPSSGYAMQRYGQTTNH